MPTNEEEGHVSVMLRLRPILEENSLPSFLSLIDDKTVKVAETEYHFDRVFSGDASQEVVFSASAEKNVEDLFEGYNGTILAYGQTGSGKTYTMMGNDTGDNSGIIPRIIERIFMKIYSLEQIEATVEVSFLEVYLEKVNDLLNAEMQNLEIHENQMQGIYIKDLTEKKVTSIEETLELLKLGNQLRAVGATNMNKKSSRSHSIFIIKLTTKDLTEYKTKFAKLFLVDLAGSEKVSKSGAEGQTLEEAKKINSSLSNLGMVINTLTEKGAHIPYRNSKLTRILQESLGGNSKTTLIITTSQSDSDEHETISSLRFGVRAKKVQNIVKINERRSEDELEILLQKAEQAIYDLQHELVEQKELCLTKNEEIRSLKQEFHDALQKVEGEGNLSESLLSKIERLEYEKAELQSQLNELEERFQAQIRESQTSNQTVRIEMLEKNMIELCEVQKQLVDQNLALKRQINYQRLNPSEDISRNE